MVSVAGGMTTAALVGAAAGAARAGVARAAGAAVGVVRATDAAEATVAEVARQVVAVVAPEAAANAVVDSGFARKVPFVDVVVAPPFASSAPVKRGALLIGILRIECLILCVFILGSRHSSASYWSGRFEDRRA